MVGVPFQGSCFEAANSWCIERGYKGAIGVRLSSGGVFRFSPADNHPTWFYVCILPGEILLKD